MKVHETRSQTHSSAEEEGKTGTRRQKTESRGHEGDHPSSKTKKAKVANNENGKDSGKSIVEVGEEFDEFCKTMKEHLSVEEMRRILEVNGQDASGSDDAVVTRCQDLMFYGPLERCPVCNGQLECTGRNYECRGTYSEWSACVYHTRDNPRKDKSLKLPEGIENSKVNIDWVKSQQSKSYPKRSLFPEDKPFAGMTISLSGRLARRHEDWKEEIEKYGGVCSKSIIGVTCLVVSPAERERGGSSKLVEAMESGIPVVSEKWLVDSIENERALPLDAYDVVSDLAPEGKGIPWDKQDPSEEALESLTAELKLYGKKSVYKDSKLEQQGGKIFERDGIIYNCAFSNCDLGRRLNEYCIMQLIVVPEANVHLYYKKGRVGDDPRAEERVEEMLNDNDAVKEFVRLFELITDNEFELWEREKKFIKKPLKFFPIDMDDGVDVRYGGLGLRQMGVAAAHCKLDSMVANFMKVLCSQEIYRYALMEMGHDNPDLPMGMLSELHLKRCEEVLLEFIEALKSHGEQDQKTNVKLVGLSSKWFTLMHSTRPFTIRNFEEFADHVAAPLESIRDIVVASHLVGDMTGATIDDPLFDRYKKLGCSVTPLDKNSDDYKMIVKYLAKTYEPIKLGDSVYDASVENIFAVESSSSPSYDEIKKMPNKVLLWCGTGSSNLLRHLQKGFLPSICSIPVPGYMFGRAIVCSDAAAEAAKYGFTAVDRPEGFLVLAIASLGQHITEISTAPEDPEALEDKKTAVKGIGRKTTDEAEHFVWKDDIKVPCGRLIESGNKNSPLEYNEYAVYDPKQASIRFLVEVKYEEQNMEMDTVE
ncbi:poly [ADP-ribose] polymerase protein [Dioscorea alata]|uniref:Poly [ADP-ribose] polymerase protein n=1 Tax=Dioscorea alata TaxID=55571 RepID=A0ACB7VZV5_DIOAL|nr:poly [ADP-ribose] polymerase protein [Dioscorea alata]